MVAFVIYEGFVTSIHRLLFGKGKHILCVNHEAEFMIVISLHIFR